MGLEDRTTNNAALQSRMKLMSRLKGDRNNRQMQQEEMIRGHSQWIIIGTAGLRVTGAW